MTAAPFHCDFAANVATGLETHSSVIGRASAAPTPLPERRGALGCGGVSIKGGRGVSGCTGMWSSTFERSSARKDATLPAMALARPVVKALAAEPRGAGAPGPDSEAASDVQIPKNSTTATMVPTNPIVKAAMAKSARRSAGARAAATSAAAAVVHAESAKATKRRPAEACSAGHRGARKAERPLVVEKPTAESPLLSSPNHAVPWDSHGRSAEARYAKPPVAESTARSTAARPWSMKECDGASGETDPRVKGASYPCHEPHVQDTEANCPCVFPAEAILTADTASVAS